MTKTHITRLFQNIPLIAVCAVLGLTLASCGGTSSSSSGETPDVDVTTIGELPRATAPVESTASSSLVAAASVQLAADTGLPLGSLAADSFDANSSRAACEMANTFRQGIGSAATGDLILCYIQQSFEANQELGIDIYDGDYHVFDLAFTDSQNTEEGGPSRIKMKIVRDANNAITEFVMYACGDSGSGSDEQSEYLAQTIGTDGAFSMTEKGIWADPSGSVGQQLVSVTGTLNENGRFTGTKEINMSYSFEDPNGSGHGAGTVTQGADTVAFDGYHVFTGDVDTFQSRVYSSAQLIDGNSATADDYNLQLLALGDGAARVLMSSSQFDSETVVEGWNGDTTEEDPDSSYITAVENQDPIAVGDAITISFTGEHAWDCTDESEGTVNIDQTQIDQACANLQLGHDYISCYEIIDGGGEPQ